MRRASIEDDINVQVISSYEQMVFWQDEVQTRKKTFEELSAQIERHLKTAPKTGVDGLEALHAYLQTGQSYLQSLRENHIAKARLEWAIGKDL